MNKLFLTITLFCCANTFAANYENFQSPSIPAADGRSYWVDSCVTEYGNNNCSNWAHKKAANAFCAFKNYDHAVKWSWRNESGNHDTFKLSITKRNGRNIEEWQFCSGCYSRIDYVRCKSN